MKTIAPLLLILFCLCPTFAGQSDDEKIISPVAQFSGISSDEDLKTLYPTHGVILDRESFANVWVAWRPTARIPNVDWETEMVLVAIVNRPSAPLVGSLKLSPEGDLTYRAPAAKIGGPGFGYSFVQLSKVGIKSINGKPMSLFTEDLINKPPKRPSDQIEVTITGTLKTGLAAIGGETTGTIIESGDITFEVDVSLNERFARLAKRLDQQKVYLKGTLTKKKGIEVGDRLIVIPTVLKKQPTSDGPVKPVNSAFVEIKINRSGGFAGLSEELTISQEGKVTNEKKRQRITENWNLTREQLNEINKLIAQTDWSKIEQKIRDPNVADDFNFEFVIETKTKTLRFFRDGTSLAKSPELAKLQKLSMR